MISADEWNPAGGIVLEKNARSAATTIDRNVVVAAGPGAGKTELLAQRADFLFRTGACPYPRRILAISFKVDAARNLRDRVRHRSGPQYAARFDSFTFHAFAKRLIDNYRLALTGADSLAADYRIDAKVRISGEQITFGDLVPLAIKILNSNAYASGSLRQTYSHVFLDEFQDATRDQYELIVAAFQSSRACLTAVGDVKQRIMAWAGALDGVLQTYAEDFDGLPLPLYQNFRSAPRLRRMQNRMIALMDPGAESSAEDLAGEAGEIRVMHSAADSQEASSVADLIESWLARGVTSREIAVLVRQQPHLVAKPLAEELRERGIPCRNEQESQDLTAEPAAALLLNFLRVVADDRQPQAYTDLMRVAERASATEDAALRFDSGLKRLIRESRSAARADGFARDSLDAWRPLVRVFLRFVSKPAIIALSPAYQQGNRLKEVVEEAIQAFGRELALDGSPVEALRRLSEEESIRILTIHKCKGLEFDKVVVLGVEDQLFWGKQDEIMSEFFVAVSRAKTELVLTHVDHRTRPEGPVKVWNQRRTPSTNLLAFADEPVHRAGP